MSPQRVALVAVCVAVLVRYAAGSEGEKENDRAAFTTTSPPVASSTTTTTLEKELTATSRVRLDGIGPVVMGMTLADATAAVGRRVAVDPPRSPVTRARTFVASPSWTAARTGWSSW